MVTNPFGIWSFVVLQCAEIQTNRDSLLGPRVDYAVGEDAHWQIVALGVTFGIATSKTSWIALEAAKPNAVSSTGYTTRGQMGMAQDTPAN